NGQIEGSNTILAFIEQFLEFVPPLVGLGIDGNVEETLAELLDSGIVVFAWFEVRLQGLACKVTILIVREGATGRADDAGGLQELTLDLAMIKRRKQLTFSKIAGAAEDDAIKGIDRDDLAAHGTALSC